MSTGDLVNNVRMLVRNLRQVNYPNEVDIQRFSDLELEFDRPTSTSVCRLAIGTICPLVCLQESHLRSYTPFTTFCFVSRCHSQTTCLLKAMSFLRGAT